ncbi:MAG TPA: class I SAM-dependent methyltransferase [Verrucomicrobiae bacterium]|nr:class I SAM-dependent methyltransferase [Verrucomicrobiae bacterium]
MSGAGESKFAFYQPDVVFFRHCIERELAGFFRRAGILDLSQKKILDIGSGWGSWLLLFLSWGARPENLCAIDLQPERVEVARQRLPKSEIVLGRAEKLPWPGDSFDLIFQFTVFSSVLPPAAREEIAEEIWRVLKPGGYFVSFDFFISHPANPNTVGIGKGELRRLFPHSSFRFRRLGIFPPLARWLAPVSITLAHLLEKTRILSGHYLAWSIKK